MTPPFVCKLFVHTFLINCYLTRPTQSFKAPMMLPGKAAKTRTTHQEKETSPRVSPFAFIEEGEASTKAQLSYISMPRYFCRSLLSVRSLNRKRDALKCCSTTTAHWRPMNGDGTPLVSLSNCDTVQDVLITRRVLGCCPSIAATGTRKTEIHRDKI